MYKEFIKINKITKIDKSATVYNFSVAKNENYFANNILTHNCYAARHAPDSFYNEQKVSTNIDQILNKVINYPVDIIKPNQTHEKYITWDLACNADIVPVLRHFDWKKVFDYFKNSDRDMGTLATKFVNKDLLKYNPGRKIRVRMTLMPEKASKVLEPKTSPVKRRIEFINQLYEAGYDVQVNFSPVIYTNNWLDNYEELFEQIDSNISEDVKKQMACEVIFLTHNAQLHAYNEKLQKAGERVLWVPPLQENKTSGFGGNNIRYKHTIKRELIEQFSNLLNKKMPYCKIRYIF